MNKGRSLVEGGNLSGSKIYEKLKDSGVKPKSRRKILKSLRRQFEF